MTRNDPAAVALQALDEKLRRDVVKNLFWSKFMGSIAAAGEDVTNDPELRPSGMPIEVNNGIKTHGIGDRMLIPMQMHLAGPATYGDATLIGNEEDVARKWSHVAYNQVRHAATLQKGAMDKLREDRLKAAQYVQSDLSLWHAQMENFFVTQALMEGISENLSTSATDATYGEGLGIAKRYHPNLYAFLGASSTQASGALSRVGTTGYFPTAQQVYIAAKNTNSSNADLGTNLYLDHYCVRKARALAMRKLRPILTMNGKKFWGWIISPEQADTLFNDEVYRSMINSQQYKELADHPLASGSIGVFGQFIFFEDAVSVRSYCAPTGMTPTYAGASGADINCLGTAEHLWDDQDKFNPRFNPVEGYITETGGLANQVSIIFGAGMLGKADAYSPQFAFEKADYDNWKGVAAGAIYGYGRLDYVKQAEIASIETAPTSCTGVYNESSILVMTWQQV